MSGKGKQVEELDLMGPAPDNGMTAAESAAAAFGAGSSLGRVQRDRITKLEIQEIYPDPLQPRRVVPTSLRRNLSVNPSTIANLLESWIAEAQISPMDYWDISEETLPEEEQSKPSQNSLIKLISLASGIYRDGLINPISVAQVNGQYFIETGERRWFAYHLLRYLFPDDEQWQRIPSRIMPEHSVWRQASENNSRDDLNAISKARQFAILMMDLIGYKKFLPLEECQNEQAFYAQVLSERIPRGENAHLMQAMGFNGRASVDRHRNLLGLPEDIWLDADDYNVPENVLREVLGKPYEDARLIIDLWLGNRTIVSIGDNSKDAIKPAWFRRLEKLSKEFTTRRLKKLDTSVRSELRAMAQNILENLDAIEND